jgi:hypothetical protein
MQDNKDDWAAECPRMAEVYTNSYLTISAASCEDSLQGFVHTTAGEVACELTRCESDLYFRIRKWDFEDNPNTPLLKRAWAVQELVLSPRILHFTARDMIFECDEHTISEGGVQSTINFKGGYAHLDKMRLKQDAQDAYDYWNYIVLRFARTNITYETDKLPAISGIAKIMQEETNDDYVAGLWKKDLPAGLLWSPIPSDAPRSQTYIAPSWSWASLNRAILPFAQDKRAYASLAIVDVQTQLTTSNTFGEVRYAFLTAMGPVKRISKHEIRTMETGTGRDPRHGRATFMPKRQLHDEPAEDLASMPEWRECDTYDIIFTFDSRFEEDYYADSFWCLACVKDSALIAGKWAPAIPSDPYGLVLVRTSDAKETYRRVGTFWVGMFAGDDSGSNWQRLGFVETTVTII